MDASAEDNGTKVLIRKIFFEGHTATQEGKNPLDTPSRNCIEKKGGNEKVEKKRGKSVCVCGRKDAFVKDFGG